MTGTGPTRLADWLPAKQPGPVLLQPPANRRNPLRQARPWTWLETLVLAGYALVVSIGIAWHEPWADESQAWLIARDSGWWQMMWHGIRYEGSPGLWHTLLWILLRLHVGFIAMHWVSGAIAAAGVVVQLRWSPFPLLLRILLPFGFWLAYQDAVIARSYVLFAVLAFSAAAILRAIAETPAPEPLPRSRLFGLAVVLGLMGNVSVHGLVASGGFALVALVLLRRRKRAEAARAAHIAIPALLLCAFWIFAVATTIPPSDVNFQAGTNVERSTERIWAKAGDRQAKAELAADQDATHDVRPGELAPIPPIKEHWTPRQALWHKIARLLALMSYPVSNFRVLALLACALLVAQAFWFRATGPMGWIGLLPWALMVLVFTSMYLSPRHAGMLWTALVAALWLTWPAETKSSSSRSAPDEVVAIRTPKFRSLVKRTQWLRHVTLAALVLVAADQAWWTAHAVWADVHRPYAGEEAMVRFLHSQGPGRRIAGFYYYSIGPEAWFHHAIYFNQPHAYWLWSRQVRNVQQAPAAIATHPDVIVVGGMEWNDDNANIVDDWVRPDLSLLHRVPLGDYYQVIGYAEAHGYRETHRFCGTAFMRDGWSERLCQVALQPTR
ncbi:MAG: hypothetical protein WA294_01760 [Acidobacteriaceae bacterium]